MNGVLIVNKPSGATSHDVVREARRLLKERRIGHTGTLDPLATGVLVLCVGKATRIARYLEAQEKEYRVVMRLGVSTDTLDADGTITETRTYAPPSRERLLAVLRDFTGDIMQRPPAFSAVKVSGVRSYALARKGRQVELAPRPVTVKRLDLLSYEDPSVGLSVTCSKGLYVRSLCADIGEALGSGAHVTSLERVRSGRFTLDRAMTIEQLRDFAEKGSAEKRLLSTDEALSDLAVVTVGPQETEKVSHGNSIPWSNASSEFTQVRVHDADGSLLAVARLGSGMLRPETVFS